MNIIVRGDLEIQRVGLSEPERPACINRQLNAIHDEAATLAVLLHYVRILHICRRRPRQSLCAVQERRKLRQLHGTHGGYARGCLRGRRLYACVLLDDIPNDLKFGGAADARLAGGASLRDGGVIIVRCDVRPVLLVHVRSSPVAKVGAAMCHVEVDATEAVVPSQDLGHCVGHVCGAGVCHGLSPVRQPPRVVLAVEGRRLATGVHDTLRCEGGTQPEVFRPEVHNRVDIVASQAALEYDVRWICCVQDDTISQMLASSSHQVTQVNLVGATKPVLILHLDHDDGAAVGIKERLHARQQRRPPGVHVLQVHRV
mmetsp:Transcript_13309/g.40269  ORF Transcript_13309/g.40269 Transcript_13309/m.40269 type:complete len:314 (+) Transcript_13309:1224-2165(+)